MGEMTFKKMLLQAQGIESKSTKNENFLPSSVFKTGAQWMHERMIELNIIENIPIVEKNNYTLYGIIKYGFCITVLCLSFYLLFLIHPVLSSLSILVFYLAEIHFLFLFPLLISGNKKPLMNSIIITYRMGILSTLLNVIPIGIYMMIGLLNTKNPLKNWYVGCLCILIWYKDETRNRI
jgi:hypothetical protein